MKRLLSIAAVLGASGLVLYATFRDAPDSSDPVASRLVLLAHFAERDGYVPPPGQCRDVEATLAGDGDGDAARRTQTPATLCNLGLGTWTQADSGAWLGPDMDRRCRQSTRVTCYDAPTADAGDEGHTDLERRCFRRVMDECQRGVQQAGGITWATPLRAATQMNIDEVRRLGRRSGAAFCACRNTRDAGMCREREADGGLHPAPYHITLQPGTYQGPGCVWTTCSESEAREQDPEGTLLDPQCR